GPRRGAHSHLSSARYPDRPCRASGEGGGQGAGGVEAGIVGIGVVWHTVRVTPAKRTFVRKIGPQMRTGFADLPLHTGRAPRWLFERMTTLSREVALAILAEEGAQGLLRRLAAPVWFQALGCVLGFDWHSSGVTTTVCGALKEGLRPVSGTGLVIAGGKGRASRKTPAEIEAACERSGREPGPLVRASRLSAKVDSAAVQDGFDVYHHTFFFTGDGTWAVVQQGMSERTGMARRYHWLTPPRFDRDPHSAVA